jgi:hypothetical protein
MRLQEQQDQVHLTAKVTHRAGISLDATLLRATEPYAPRLESLIPLDPDTLEKKEKKREAAREGWKTRKLAKEEAMEQEARNKMIRAEARRKATEERARLAAGAFLSSRASCLSLTLGRTSFDASSRYLCPVARINLTRPVPLRRIRQRQAAVFYSRSPGRIFCCCVRLSLFRRRQSNVDRRSQPSSPISCSIG